MARHDESTSTPELLTGVLPFSPRFMQGAILSLRMSLECLDQVESVIEYDRR
jgi:hypothetical protein